MSQTKRVALHDKIMIDGEDVSGAFQTFGLTSDDATVDASGFSVSGSDETLSGTRAEGFNGTAFNTPELRDLLWPIHKDRSIVEVWWQENGLIDPTGDVFYGYCQLRSYSPTNTRGSVSTTPINFVVADENGITKAAAS